MKRTSETIVLLFLTCLTSLSFGLSIYDTVVSSIKCSCDRVSGLDVSGVQVYVYNYESDSTDGTAYNINEAADAILKRDDFNPNQCINIFVLGFNTPQDTTTGDTIRCTFSKISCNGTKPLGIIIDHNEYTHSSDIILEIPKRYKESVKYAKSIGDAVGSFLVSLFKKVSRSLVNIIGHSIGGQMVGYAARMVSNVTGQQLPAIYAADPAGPCYKDCPSEHIQSGDAKLVVSFHCTKFLGTTLRICDYDFISGDGETQFDCSMDLSLIGMESEKCSHFKCVPISTYPAIASGIWKSKMCESYAKFTGNSCDDNDNTLAGYTLKPTGKTGKYYFTPSDDNVCDKI